MKRHLFGDTDLRVSEYGFGCARIGGVFQGDPRDQLNLLARAADLGINFFDTSDMYSQGQSERLLARAFRGRRDRVVIATKAGYTVSGRRRLIGRVKPLLRPLVRLIKLRRARLPAGVRGGGGGSGGGGSPISQDFSPAYLKRAVEGSLKRLRTDYIDLFQLHSPPLEVVQRGEWREALEQMKRAGQIRYWGLSCDTVDVSLAALEHEGISSLQFALSLLHPQAAETIAPRLAEKGIGGIARECLGAGMLAKPRSELDLSKFCGSPEEEKERDAELARLHARAAERGKPLATLALEYPASVKGVAVTLVGAHKTAQLTELFRALED